MIPRATVCSNPTLVGVFCAMVLGAFPLRAAVGDAPFVSHQPAAMSFALVAENATAPLFVDDNDWPGVVRAGRDLQADVERVTGVKPAIESHGSPPRQNSVIIGTIGRSKFVDDLIAAEKIDVSNVRGRWEAFLIEVVEQPLPGVERALVIAGSDQRGTIFGLYTLSEQIGVSPWYWWADVPVARRGALYVPSGTRLVEAPVVRYRGIFLNDEAPALTGWVHEKFGGFNHTFYAKVFELLLRLRANYLWPAMWRPRSFYDDDPLNPPLADEYGIVMGTSHHEPMMRAHDEWSRYGQGPWNYATNDEELREFWRGGLARVRDFDKIVTIGMRGDGDEAMSEDTNVALLERIVADQRDIIRDVMDRDPEQVPQLWALYKEVQGYYERGMRVPDDVILLWCDDNWGNIRRLPTLEERGRIGGAGVYYHFDYVGGPRNYKWINVTPITKVWEQMHLAWRHQADRLWIVNVGDLKPMEFPIEFFLTYAWDPARWPSQSLDDYSLAWAAREFGAEHAPEVAALINGYSKLNRHRTPELLTPETYSLIHYREAERVLARWRELVERAEHLNAMLAPEYRGAFFQLVLYPVKASATVRELQVAVGLNRLYVAQGRVAANTQAARVHALAAQDAALKEAYHALNGGKWNHLMSEKKFGYTYWQTPTTEALPAVSVVRRNAGAVPALAVEGSEWGWPVWGAPPPAVPAIDVFRKNVRWIELFNRGDTDFTFNVTVSEPWLQVTPPSGSVHEITRLEIGADWSAVPSGTSNATVTLGTSTGVEFSVVVPVLNPAAKPPPDFAGFVEGSGYVSIEAPHFSRAVNDNEVNWRVLPDHGRTLGGVTVFPVTEAERQPGGDTPRLEYEVWLDSPGELSVQWHCAPSLDFQSGEGLRFGVSIDDQPPRIVKLDTWATLQTWEKSVADSVRIVTTEHSIDQPGRHVLKFWMVTPGVVLQKVVIDSGGLNPSYLGPPESARRTGQ